MMNNAEKPQLTIPRVTSSVSYDLFGNHVLDAKRTMSDYFGVAPFSILNTTDKDWINRKQRWNKLINDTGQARKNVLAGGNSEKDLCLLQANRSRSCRAVGVKFLGLWAETRKCCC